MSRRKSISQRLRTARPERRLEIVQDWAKNWETDQLEAVRRLGAAVKDNDYDELCIAVGELKAITEKRFAGLASALKILADDI